MSSVCVLLRTVCVRMGRQADELGRSVAAILRGSKVPPHIDHAEREKILNDPNLLVVKPQFCELMMGMAEDNTTKKRKAEPCVILRYRGTTKGMKAMRLKVDTLPRANCNRHRQNPSTALL